MLLALLIALTQAAALPVWAGDGAASDITVVGWNVESGGADPLVIGERLAEFEDVDLWGLSEVNSAEDGETFEAATEIGEGTDFESILSVSGGGDRLLAVYDTDRFALVGYEELDEINVGGNVRAALVLHLLEKDSGQELLFMVNHLYRSDAAARLTQAQLLNEWASQQTLPALAVGDYNFDWDIRTDAHDAGYDRMTADGHWAWVRPPALVTTQCSGWPCQYESVLDFVFVAGPARDRQAMSEIVVEPGDFPDDERTSDHRPVLARFVMESGGERGGDTYLPALFKPGTAVEPPPNCHPAYPTVCIPAPPPDLDCQDIPFRNFTVLPPDPHRFDGDGDGVGCRG